jgi:hypothetical protein
MSYSVLIHWRGKGTYNETIDAHTQLTKRDAKLMSEIYAQNKNSRKVQIISYKGFNKHCEMIKGGIYEQCH